MKFHTMVLTIFNYYGQFLQKPAASSPIRGWLGTITLLMLLATPVTQAGWWNALGTGVDNSVMAITSDSSDNLYVGGLFTTAGGTSANNIAKWNGSSWSALGTGMNNDVYVLAMDSSGNLYVGGKFTTAGGTPASRIAKWDGSSWSTLGTGMDSNFVYALALDSNGNWYAGGLFATAGGTSANKIAKWNGSSWSALGTGMNFVVNPLALDSNGNLYAGGGFSTAGGTSANYIAKWNGSTWSALGTGMNNDVWALAFDSSGNLYAGGNFTTADGTPANYIAKWNGSTWSALGTGMNNAINALAFDRSGNLYAGGNFTTAGGTSANYIAKWNGSTWSALGTGMNNNIDALAFDSSGNLYAGGVFTTADGTPANRIAKAIAPLTSLTSSLNPSSYGVTVTFTAVVTPSSATGTVIFQDGTTPLSTVSLTSGSATLALNNLSIGSHSLTAIYSGDTNNLGSVSSSLSQIVTQINQTITFGTLSAKTDGDAPFTLTATASSGLTVTYTATGNCSVSGNTVTLTSAGTCDITAHQTGDSNYLPATDVIQTLTINPVPPPIIPQPGPAWVANLTPYQDTGLGVRVTIDGTGQGRVVSTQGMDGKSIDCSSANQSTGCQASFVPATYVTLTPLPAEGSVFRGWGGNEDCNKESFLINGGILCTAYFQSLNHTLTVEVNGRGKITTEKFKCPPTCQSDYQEGTVVTLQARPAPSWTFTGWSGDCEEFNRGITPLAGVLSLTTDKHCGVTFLDDPNIPNQGDGNGDGLKDAEQDNVISLPDKVSGNYLTLEVDKGCTLSEMSTDSVDKVAGYNQKYQYPQGLVYFDIACANTTVTLYLHGISKITRRFVLQKYGPKVPGDARTIGWYQIPQVTFDTVKVGSQSVMRASYTLVDGEVGDNTGVDGHIIDPAGVAWEK